MQYKQQEKAENGHEHGFLQFKIVSASLYCLRMGEELEACSPTLNVQPQLLAVELQPVLQNFISSIDELMSSLDHQSLLTLMNNSDLPGLLKALQPFAQFDQHCYTRNLVWSVPEKYDLILLCWSSKQASSIHDHSGSHCVMLVLEGRLEEMLYTEEEDCMDGEKLLRISRQTGLLAGQATYIHDRIGWHRVANLDSEKPALSLHIYTPPIRKYQTYCEQSGCKRASANVCFTSVNRPK